MLSTFSQLQSLMLAQVIPSSIRGTSWLVLFDSHPLFVFTIISRREGSYNCPSPWDVGNRFSNIPEKNGYGMISCLTMQLKSM